MINNAAGKSVSLLAEFNATEVLNLLADGAYITDTERRIVFWNDAARRITGWEAKDVVGHRCGDNILVHVDKDGHELCGREHCPLHRSIVTGQASPEPILVFAQQRSGDRIPVEVTVSPIRNHGGEVIGGIEMFRDLTESYQDQLRAKEIQDLAVRSELPQDDRVRFELCYEPRDLVGGDFFRIENLDADRYAILVADARGHGVSAALYTMLLRSLWLEHHRVLDSPARFMGLINEPLHALVQDSGFFGSAVMVLYNAATGHVRLVRAGHPAPLHFQRGGAPEAIGKPGPALGLFQQSQYRETEEHLAPGDALLLYTDGATELFDREDHELGTEGLQELVRAQAPGSDLAGFHLDALKEQLLRFSNAIHLPDDLTLVKLNRLR
jgi:phosphoserine phosphatase RsbU/P